MGKISNTPTPEQSKWLKENYNKVKAVDIANKYDITTKRLSEWFKILGIKKDKKVYAGRKKTAREKRNFKNAPIPKLSREYSNVTRDQHIDRILSIQL